jgi:eukaryotic-like serine/threonine-protein kinase
MNEPDERSEPAEVSTVHDDPNALADVASVADDSLAAGLAAGFARLADEPADDLPTVPGYQVLRELARGGMGRVLAAHDPSLGRDVAIKVLLPGANSDRFVRESKITAQLPHPGIPPVHALGTLANGSPFLVMKLIAGQTLADELGTADRPRMLRTFAQVCDAVGFAHSRGIIHRDLKPGNIMVGAFGEVQVMDWGLAKDLTSQPVEDAPRPSEVSVDPFNSTDAGQPAPARSPDDRTRPGSVMGTPAYMAPEQARGEAIDARSDVFALGGILCTILSGKPPFSGKSSWEVIRQAKAADLADANARLDGCGADEELLALCRHCLSPNRADRPADGQVVADGLTAYLNGVQERLHAAEVARAAEAARAVEATLTAAEANERARAERRARRVQLVAASLLLLVLTGGVVGTTFGLIRAKQATSRAVAAEGDARKRAAELEQVSDFQAQMLKQVDPAAAGLRLTDDVKARFEASLKKAGAPDAERAREVEAFVNHWSRVNATDASLALIDSTILKPAVAAIDKQFQDQPAVDATLRATLAERYHELGLYEAARPLLERALEMRRRVLGEEHPDTLESIDTLGVLLSDQGERELAMRYYQEALEKRRRILGQDHAETLRSLNNIAGLLYDQGQRDKALEYHREALEKRRRVLGEDHPDTLASIYNVADVLRAQSKPNEAMELLREVIEKRRRVLGQDHVQTLNSISTLGIMLKDQGRLGEAVDRFREVLEKRRRLQGEAHPKTLEAARNLGAMLDEVHQDVEAEALMRGTLQIERRSLGASHPDTLQGLSNLAVYLIRRGKVDEAEPMCRESLEQTRRVLGRDHPRTLIATNVMGYLLRNQKRLAEAEPYLREALATSRRINGETHRDTLTYTFNLGVILQQQGKLDEAESYLRSAAEKAGAALGPANLIKLTATSELGNVLNRQGRFEESSRLLDAAVKVARENPTSTSKDTLAYLLTYLGNARTRLKAFDEAEAALLEAYPILFKSFGLARASTQNCIRGLVELYNARHAAQPGRGYDANAAEWKAKLGAK